MAEAQDEEEPSIEEILDSIRQIISDDDEEEGDSPEDMDATQPQEDVAPAEESVSEEDIPESESVPEPEPDFMPAQEDTIPPVTKDLPKEDAIDPDSVIELTEKVEEPQSEQEKAPIEIDMQESVPEPEPEYVSEPEPAAQEEVETMKEPDPEPSPPEPEPESEPSPQQPSKSEKEKPEASDNMSSFDTILTESAESAAIDAFTALAARANIERGGGVTVEDIVREEIRPLLRNWVDRHLPPMVERLLQKELEKISSRVDDL